MLKCLKCKKEFKYQSDLNKHQNRKTPCNKDKLDLKCELCNVTFKCPYDQQRHEKTKKHITNIQNLNITNGNFINGDNINNIINLTVSINSFKNTDLSYLRKWIIDDVGNDLYIKTITKSYLIPQEQLKLLFRGVIEILEHLHFNLNNDDNHNCKILLMFPGIKKQVYEYLILEIEAETNKIYWNSLKYKDFIKELINHLTKMNANIQNKNFEKFIDFIEKYLIHESSISKELKPYIENELGELYMNFNKNQKKESRIIKGLFEDKIKEYINYRKKECRLNNGYIPNITNSNI